MSSGHNDHGQGHGQAGGGADAVRYDMVIKVGVASLIIFALSIWVAGMIWKDVMHTSETKSGRARTFVVDKSRTEIGIVDQVPFVTDTRLHEWRDDRKRELETYTWVDKGKGIVRIPITEAMRMVAAGRLPAGAPK
jgi:hypothetical protein